MSYYEDIYQKRINRFGNDYQSRLQGQREKVFEDLLCKSVYRVDFVYNHVMQPALLERYKQDETKTMQYLLTRLDLKLPHGTLLDIEDSDGNTVKWMVYWLEQIQASGYNRYIVLKMTHTITWTHELGQANPTYFTQYGYVYGKYTKALRDTDYGTNPVYLEQTAEDILIMPFTETLKKDDYFELTSGSIVSPYQVVGIELQSNPGVQYVTLDPIYQFDKTVTPTQPVGDTSNDYDWFTGNFKED